LLLLDDNKNAFLNKMIKAVKKLFFFNKTIEKHIETELLDRVV